MSDSPARDTARDPATTTATAAAQALLGCRDLAARYDLRDEFRDIVGRMRASRSERPSVVIVGEISRGKSTLINALLGVPGFATVGELETTSLVVNYEPADEAHRVGSAALEFEREPRLRPMHPHDLEAWIAAAHDDDEPGGTPVERPLQAHVRAPDGLLPGVTLVDTPGTGGLSEAYALRALRRAEAASVLVLVTDASGRITKPALEFLASCAERVDRIVVAVNKIDVYRHGWQAVLEENRQIILGSHARLRRVEIVGVSAM